MNWAKPDSMKNTNSKAHQDKRAFIAFPPASAASRVTSSIDDRILAQAEESRRY
jgi:hypothetical protein